MMRFSSRAIWGTVATAAMSAVIATMTAIVPANATLELPGLTIDHQAISAQKLVSGDEFEEMVEELIKSDVPRTVTTEPGMTVMTFHFSDDVTTFDMAVAIPDEGMMTPQVGGGWDSKGPYLLLNSFDQDVIISGGGAAIGFLICGSFPPACLGATMFIAVATVWLSYNGKCSNNRQLKLPFIVTMAGILPLAGQHVSCVYA